MVSRAIWFGIMVAHAGRRLRVKSWGWGVFVFCVYFATHLPDASWSILPLLPANERIDDEDVEFLKPPTTIDDGDEAIDGDAAGFCGDDALIVRCTFCLRLWIRSRFHCGISGRNEGVKLLMTGEMLPPAPPPRWLGDTLECCGDPFANARTDGRSFICDDSGIANICGDTSGDRVGDANMSSVKGIAAMITPDYHQLLINFYFFRLCFASDNYLNCFFF